MRKRCYLVAVRDDSADFSGILYRVRLVCQILLIDEKKENYESVRVADSKC